MANPRFQTFSEFWPFYLGEHSNRTCRSLHLVGNTLGLGWVGLAIAQRNPWLCLAALLNGYAFAWVGHFFFEHNRPATFTYPLWSFAADWKMYALFLSGRLSSELKARALQRSAP
jgi:hypothetical protein